VDDKRAVFLGQGLKRLGFDAKVSTTDLKELEGERNTKKWKLL